MKSAFVATSYKDRETMSDALDLICDCLSENGYTPLVFVRAYHFRPDNAREMMQTSFHHIRDCDLFVAEMTFKVAGVGIEAGYAYAHHKPIIYLCREQASLSTNLTGIADYQITYGNNQDLKSKLHEILGKMTTDSTKSL